MNVVSFPVQAEKCCRAIDVVYSGELYNIQWPWIYIGIATDRDTGIQVFIRKGHHTDKDELKTDLAIALIDHLQKLGVITGSTQLVPKHVH